MDIIYISHINQFVIADFIVNHYRLDDVQIVLQCSRQNAVELQTQAVQRLTSLPYGALRFLFLPDRPYQLRYSLLQKVDAIFKKFFEETRPTRVFMFSRERHYTLLVKRAREVKAKICYVEEGASTYALRQGLLDGEVLSGTRFLRSVGKAIKKNWQGTLLWELLSYPYRVYNSLRAIIRSHDAQLLRLKFSRRYSEVFTHDPVFDQALTVYPELAQKSIKASEYLPLPPDFRMQEPKDVKPLPEKRFLMVMPNGKYCPLEEIPTLYKWMRFIINDIAHSNGAVVELKPHPADGQHQIDALIGALKNERIRLVDKEALAVSAETLLTRLDSGYRAVFTVNSAVFLYLDQLRPSLPMYTIGPLLNSFLRKEKFSKNSLHHGENFTRLEFQPFSNIKSYTLGLKVGV